MGIVVLGTGSDLPAQVVSNDDIEQASLDYDPARSGCSLHEWVMKRAGVAVRHRIAPGEGTSDMAARATRRALEDAGLRPGDLDLVVLGTFTSDARLPSSVSTLQRDLGTTAKCLQLETACTGFLDAMHVATALMASAGYRTAAVVAAEAMSAVVDKERFLYQSIFGDGAGAVILQLRPDLDRGVEVIRSHTDATHCEWTWIPGGGTKHPITKDVLASRSQYLRLAYKQIYDFAIEKMFAATYEVLDVLGVTIDEVDWLVPHQPGANIVEDMVRQLPFPRERVAMCVEHTGNVSGATLAIALDEARRTGRFRDGDRIVMPVVGAGMAWGALSLRWHEQDERSVA